MPAHVFVLQVMALVLAVAGVLKIVDPTPVVRALTAARLPAGAIIGRVLGAAEVATGVWVLGVGDRWSAAALAGLYGAFIVFIASNRVRGLHVPCGCLGESTEPPGPAHVIVDGIGVAVGVVAVAAPAGSALEWMDHGWPGALVLIALVITAAAVVVALDWSSRIGRGRTAH